MSPVPYERVDCETCGLPFVRDLSNDPLPTLCRLCRTSGQGAHTPDRAEVERALMAFQQACIVFARHGFEYGPKVDDAHARLLALIFGDAPTETRET